MWKREGAVGPDLDVVPAVEVFGGHTVRLPGDSHALGDDLQGDFVGLTIATKEVPDVLVIRHGLHRARFAMEMLLARLKALGRRPPFKKHRALDDDESWIRKVCHRDYCSGSDVLLDAHGRGSRWRDTFRAQAGVINGNQVERLRTPMASESRSLIERAPFGETPSRPAHDDFALRPVHLPRLIVRERRCRELPTVENDGEVAVVGNRHLGDG